MVNASDFAKRLQKILDYYGLSATAFSEELDFNRSTISHLLSGRNKPSLEFVMKVLQKYPEVELYWLLNGKGRFPDGQNDDPTPISEKKTDSVVVKKAISSPTKSIEKIIVLYADGSFDSYEP